MSTSRNGRVLVATSGSAASQSAIAFAARSAASHGLALEIVHVITPSLVGPYDVSPDVALRGAGRELLASAAELARRFEPHVDLSTTLLIGSRPEAIVDLARDAALVVVGRPPQDHVGRLSTGSTVTGVAARATCPVAVIPAEQPKARRHQVLVGLKSKRHADELLAAAFSVASQTGSELRIVHARQMLSPYDSAVAKRLPDPQGEIAEGLEVDGLLIDLRLAYPNVQVHVDLVQGLAGHTLVEASREAEVLVISRPVHGGFVHHLGAAARAVLREAHCPVLVVPPGNERVTVPYIGAEVAATS